MPNTNAVLPLTADKTILKRTHRPIRKPAARPAALGGTSWAWYMLSPKWSSIWTGPAQPGSYADVTAKQSNGAPVLRKVAVLMTDGVYNSLRGNKDQNPAMSPTTRRKCAPP